MACVSLVSRTVPFQLDKVIINDIILSVSYEVRIGNKALKRIAKAPREVQELLVELVLDLRDKGPIRTAWPNSTSLSSTTYLEFPYRISR